MASEQMAALLASVVEDPSLAARFRDVASTEGAVAVAADLGFSVTAEDFDEAAATFQSEELTDAELASAAGGFTQTHQPGCPTIGVLWKPC